MQNTKQFLGRRAQMCFVGVGLWLLLLLWSASAFWAHIDELQESYRFASKAGALAGEFALLAMVLWHCFDKHIGVRRWSLILGFLLAGVILIHAGALRGMREARNEQHRSVEQLANKLTVMSNEQLKASAEANAQYAAKLKAQGIRQRERMAQLTKAQNSSAEAAKAAQENLTKAVMSVEDKVKDSSILPRWYLDGWMYSVIFVLSLALVGIIFLMMMNQGDIDENFDGIPDREQPELFPQYEWQPPVQSSMRVKPKVRPAQSSGPSNRPRDVWRDNSTVNEPQLVNGKEINQSH